MYTASIPPGQSPLLLRRLLRQMPGWVAVACLCSACRTSPDLAPFANATSQIATSIKTGGRTVSSEINAMSADWNGPQRDQARKIGADFAHRWSDRNALADALLNYSASLTAIAQAGEQGETSARQVADAFGKLCGAIDVALPPAAAGAEAVKLGSYLYGRFAQDHAARTLGASMQRLQPVVDEAAVQLGLSLLQIEDALDAIRTQVVADANSKEIDGIKVGTERNIARALASRRNRLLEEVIAGIDAREQLREKLRSPGLSSGDRETIEQELARLTRSGAELSTELATVEASWQASVQRLAPVAAQTAADRERLGTQIALVQATRTGLSDWAAAHSRIAAAALEKHPLQVDDLVQAAVHIQNLVRAVQDSPKH